ncbi:hypothetical protein BT93_I1762 [Corymbia citriodora subsp. variegata]|nr:hypothetical protein BT93_I1762 [Corymbia citriodora subsp. variegata]
MLPVYIQATVIRREAGMKTSTAGCSTRLPVTNKLFTRQLHIPCEGGWREGILSTWNIVKKKKKEMNMAVNAVNTVLQRDLKMLFLLFLVVLLLFRTDDFLLPEETRCFMCALLLE